MTRSRSDTPKTGTGDDFPQSLGDLYDKVTLAQNGLQEIRQTYNNPDSEKEEMETLVGEEAEVLKQIKQSVQWAAGQGGYPLGQRRRVWQGCAALLAALMLAIAAAGVGAEDGAEGPFPPAFVPLTPDTGLLSENQPDLVHHIHLFPHWLLESDEQFSLHDYTGRAYLDLDVGDYAVRFAAVPFFDETSFLGFEIAELSVTGCGEGRDNRVFAGEDGFDVIMFCPGVVEWTISSADPVLAVVVIAVKVS